MAVQQSTQQSQFTRTRILGRRVASPAPFYLFVRLLFALIAAGSLPVMMDAASLWSAFYLGISAPLVFDRLARGLQPDKPSSVPLAVVSREIH